MQLVDPDSDMVWTPSVSYAVALDRMILFNRDKLGWPLITTTTSSDSVDSDTVALITGTLRSIFGAGSEAMVSVTDRLSEIRSRKGHMDDLLTRPGIEQRTDPWYTARHGLVTASDIDAAIKNGPSREFLKKKCGLAPVPTSSAMASGGPAPLKHGVMFEPVANEVYRRRQGGGCLVHEFGLLLHPTIAHLGASPDGINELGVMVEIKCPYSRKIDGGVPGGYFAQIQGQLEVCGLDECDYVECEISNSISTDVSDAVDVKAFYADPATIARHPDEFGVIFERDGFVYSPPGISLADLLIWEVSQTGQTSSCHTCLIHRWHLVRMSVVRVERDPQYVAGMLVGLESAWATVMRYRGDPDAFKREVVDAGRSTSSKEGASSNAPMKYAFVLDGDEGHNIVDAGRSASSKEGASSYTPIKYAFVQDGDEGHTTSSTTLLPAM